MQKIGSLKINGKAFLAPMADYTNVAFRELCREYGAALVYTELISVKGLLHKSKKTKEMLAVSEKEKPVFLQLFGNVPEEFARAIKLVEENYPNNFAGYDLNAGCSVPKAQKGMYGSSLLDYPKLIGNIVASMKSATKKPITVKMRLGLQKETFLECAKEAEKNGANAICVHARLGADGYSGKADWSKIKILKELISIPVIGNGDIDSAESASKMIKETNCDFVMVGRATIGNAFLFKQINSALSGKKVPEKTAKDSLFEAKKYLELAEEQKLKANDVRGYFIGWTKGQVGAPALRNKLALTKTVPEIKELIKSITQKED